MVQKKSKKVLIIFSDFYPEISANLINGAKSYLTSNNIFFDKIRVDGSLEIPFVLHKLQNDYLGFIVLGCVIKGETDHYDFICNAVSNGIMQLNISCSIPVIFCVLTDHNKNQSLDRSGGKLGNKGAEAAIAALKMISFK